MASAAWRPTRPWAGGGGGNTCGTAATLDAAGNLLIAVGEFYVVAARTGTFYGERMVARHIYRIPQAGFGGDDVLPDRAGNLVAITTYPPPAATTARTSPAWCGSSRPGPERFTE